MKTITEIANEIKDEFISNETLKSAYGITGVHTFDSIFPASTFEANIINVIATGMAAMEWQQGSYKEDIEALILQTFPGTIAWYHSLVMAFVYDTENIVK